MSHFVRVPLFGGSPSEQPVSVIVGVAHVISIWPTAPKRCSIVTPGATLDVALSALEVHARVATATDDPYSALLAEMRQDLERNRAEIDQITASLHALQGPLPRQTVAGEVP